MAIQSEVSRKEIRGPGLFLAQFLGDLPPFDTLEGLGAWAAGLGFVAVQLPTSSPGIFDLAQAAESQTYADEVTGQLAALGLSVSELSTHLQGQLVAVHPAYDALFAGFAPTALRGDKKARSEWAAGQVLLAAQASARMGLTAHATFSGALAWPYMYPWPQRPEGLVDEAFGELARLWRPILDAFDAVGVDVCFELHPGEDLHDGATFERFVELLGGHARANILYDPSHMLLQQMDYLGFLDLFHDRVKAFHVKDAEFRPSARSGVYGGYQDWLQRPGRFRSTGDGQIDFRGIFSKLAQYGYAGWAVLEWEDCLRDGEDGARRGAAFIRENMLRLPQHAFDDFAGSGVDRTGIHALLGLPPADV